MVDESQRAAETRGASTRTSGTELSAAWSGDQRVRFADRLLSASPIGPVGRSALEVAGDTSHPGLSTDGGSPAAVSPVGRGAADDLTNFRSAAAASRQEGRGHRRPRLQPLKEEHLS